MNEFDAIEKEFQDAVPLTKEELRALIETSEAAENGKEYADSDMEWIAHCAKIAGQNSMRKRQEGEESSSQAK